MKYNWNAAFVFVMMNYHTEWYNSHKLLNR